MSDYRRFISYMYLYENGVKTMNAGFVKVESRNGQCRISLSLKNVYTETEHYQAYMFLRFGQELRGIYMGNIKIKNHGSEWNFRTDTGNIAGSGYKLEQMSGMIIKSEGNKFYGTRWDQGDLDIRQFVTQWQESDLPVSEWIPDETEQEDKMPETEILPDETSETVVYAQEEERGLTVTEKDERCKNFCKILEQCPGMYPFEDDLVDTCVRLEPKDIGLMPIDCWSFGSNSFLLHGYYSYRHLIFARMKEAGEGNKSYILGVPGTQHSREAFMANMFGFREFKPIREDGENSSNFGYWYTFLG